jgi:hypothetical protein
MSLRTSTLILTCWMLVGCAVEEPENYAVGSTRSAISTDNRLIYNRLVYNRLVYNQLVYNRLIYNRLADNRLQLASLGSPPIEATAEGRDLLTYIARCAFTEGDVLIASYEGQTYEFPGLLGLAPEWEHRGLSLSEQRVISACLLAHVNAFGTSVLVSLRSEGYIPSGADERTTFPVYEATFFGQVFGEGALHTYVCQGDEQEIALAHSASRTLRVCSDGTNECGIVSLGRCRDVCEQRLHQQGWTGCHAGGQRYDETISSYLLADDPDGQNRSCGADQDCTLAATPSSAAILDCSAGNNCSAICQGNSRCTLDGAISDNFDALVRSGTMAEVNCLDANNCNVRCESASCEMDCGGANNCQAECLAGSSCTIDCRGANNCDEIHCRSGANCTLRCDGSNNCGFAACPSGAVTCGDGTVVCGPQAQCAGAPQTP